MMQGEEIKTHRRNILGEQRNHTTTTAEEPVINLQDLRAGGTEIHYLVLCPRKCWWYTHGIEQEHSGGATASAGQENVALGTLVHETTYTDRAKRDILIDDLLRLDFTEGGAVREIKKSHGGAQAHAATVAQLVYYLYYLRHEKGIETHGVIEYPTERRTERVELTDEAEGEMASRLLELRHIRDMPTPPKVEKPMAICKKCAYQDLCWG